LTLERALAIALANNPDVRAAAWQVAAARARQRQAWSAHLPTLDFGLAYRHHWHKERLVPARGQSLDATFSRDIFAGDFVLKIPLLAGGRVVSAVAEHKLLAKAARRRLQRTRGELTYNVKSVFFAILGERRLITAIERSRAALAEHLRVTRALIAERKAARVDRLNLEVRLAELDHLRVTQHGRLRILERLLASLLGFGTVPGGRLTVKGTLRAPQGPTDGRRLALKALKMRPDLTALTLELRAQARRVDAVRAEYWPVLSASVSYGARLSARGEYDDLGFAGLELSFPVFGWVATGARVTEERAKLRVLQQTRRKLALSIRQEVESATLQVAIALAQVKYAKKAITAATESLRITRAKVAAARGTAMDVLDAQAALLHAEARYVAALVGAHTCLALLAFATGRRS
jgi:outer membrane protein TolC